MNVVVDRQRCRGNALCMATLPEVFDVDDDGVAHVLDEHPSDDLRSKLQLAVRRCPTEAITLED